jgi:hypothetical protein
MNNLGKLCSWMSGVLLLCAAVNLQAATVTYNYVITGDVLVGDEFDANDFNLTGNFGSPGGDTITAYGIFTADLSVVGNVTVIFESGSGNTMTIDLNGTLLTAANDDRYASALGKPSLTFNTFNLNDFDFTKTSSPAFNSNFMQFDDFDNLLGEWRSTVSLTAVPVPPAIWLFGSGLLGMAAVARRKMLS